MEHLQAARNDKHSSVKNILIDDVERIWVAFCDHILKQLTEQIGVKVKNLGVITVKSLNLDVGRRNLSITKPSFILDEKQSQHYGIKYGRPFTSYQKNQPVNFAEIATASNTTRDIAEMVINELIMAFWKKFAEKQRANFTISDVLTIHLKEDVVRAVFAAKVVELFEFAPTKKTVHFRREYTLPVVSQSTDAAFQPEMPQKSKSDLDENWSFWMPSSKPPVTTHKNRLTTKSASVSSMSTTRESDPELEVRREVEAPAGEPPAREISPPLVEEPAPIKRVSIAQPVVSDRPQVPDRQLSDVKSKWDSSRFVRSLDFRSREYPTRVSYHRMVAQKQKELSKCHEQKCQKEMCYICTQRAERNIPVYTRKLEEEEDRKMAKILLDAEQKLAVESIRQDKIRMQEQRQVNKEYSSYNLEEAEYVNEKRKIENSHPLPHASYVMRERPLTPHKSVGHKLVAGELIGQMNLKESRKSKTQKDKKLIEKVYQLQLAEEIAREREEFWREKQENKNKLHATYQYQMATREPQLPRAYSDGKVFGKHDLNKEKLAKIKDRNRAYATENSNIHHRYLTARKASVDRSREGEIMMLKRTKTDLENDTLRRDKHKVAIRRDLESNWVDLHRAKRDREFDEKVGIPEKITVSEQLDHYRRCGQCKRAPNQRAGQTNIWKESYYTPGSRIVV